MLQVLHKGQIIQAVAFAAGRREAVWFEEGQITESALQRGDKTFHVWEKAHGKSEFLTFLQLAFYSASFFAI